MRLGVAGIGGDGPLKHGDRRRQGCPGHRVLYRAAIRAEAEPRRWAVGCAAWAAAIIAATRAALAACAASPVVRLCRASLFVPHWRGALLLPAAPAWRLERPSAPGPARAARAAFACAAATRLRLPERRAFLAASACFARVCRRAGSLRRILLPGQRFRQILPRHAQIAGCTSARPGTPRSRPPTVRALPAPGRGCNGPARSPASSRRASRYSVDGLLVLALDIQHVAQRVVRVRVVRVQADRLVVLGDGLIVPPAVVQRVGQGVMRGRVRGAGGPPRGTRRWPPHAPPVSPAGGPACSGPGRTPAAA